MSRRPPEVALALDRPSLDEALELVDLLGEAGTFYKVGLELFSRAGPAAVEALRERGKRVFLDLKLHDIPATVAGAVRAAGDAGAELVTVHVGGGARMMEEAARAAGEGGGAVRLVGVTVLTSLAGPELEAVWGRPVASVEDEVVRLARLALDGGLDGVVASPREAAAIRRALGRGPLLVTPGIRLPGGDVHDQARVSTPERAARLGADCLVVGRAVTAAADPVAALAAVHRALASAGVAGDEARQGSRDASGPGAAAESREGSRKATGPEAAAAGRSGEEP